MLDLEKEIVRMREPLYEIMEYNQLKNDLDCYLYNVCLYGLGINHIDEKLEFDENNKPELK